MHNTHIKHQTKSRCHHKHRPPSYKLKTTSRSNTWMLPNLKFSAALKTRTVKADCIIYSWLAFVRCFQFTRALQFLAVYTPLILPDLALDLDQRSWLSGWGFWRGFDSEKIQAEISKRVFPILEEEICQLIHAYILVPESILAILISSKIMTIPSKMSSLIKAIRF